VGSSWRCDRHGLTKPAALIIVSDRRAILVIGLAYGDCGKGSIVDFLTRQYAAGLVVRFNGGPQAGHNVVTLDGRHHTFSQFGSGSFVSGVKTLLSRFMFIEPYALLNEARHLGAISVGDAMDRLLIDRRCPVITPCHVAANRIRERARGDSAHGTCGLGVGELAQDLIACPDLMLYADDLANRAKVRAKLRRIHDLKREQVCHLIDSRNAGAGPLLEDSWIDVAVDVYEELARAATLVDDRDIRSLLCAPDAVVFEGAQGVLLDESFGFHPHTTWSNTTFANAERLLCEARYDGEQLRLGVLRSYFTRHGHGPFVTEDSSLRGRLPEPHNSDAGWQGEFRIGAFDAVAARYAIEASGGVDALGITHLDRVAELPPMVCSAYRDGDRTIQDIPLRRPADLDHQEDLTRLLWSCEPVYQPVPTEREAFLEVLRHQLRVPIGIESFGPTADAKHARC
jgi:adenylosuccinate synthase